MSDVFGDYPKVRRALEHAGITSVATIMMLPRTSLMEIRGIGSNTASLICRVMCEFDLEERDPFESMIGFVGRVFGRVANAPIGILQVNQVRERGKTQSLLSPLEIITLLTEIEPQMTVLDLIKLMPTEIAEMIDKLGPDPLGFDVEDQIEAIEKRLGIYDLTLYHRPLNLRFVGILSE